MQLLFWNIYEILQYKWTPLVWHSLAWQFQDFGRVGWISFLLTQCCQGWHVHICHAYWEFSLFIVFTHRWLHKCLDNKLLSNSTTYLTSLPISLIFGNSLTLFDIAIGIVSNIRIIMIAVTVITASKLRTSNQTKTQKTRKGEIWWEYKIY